MGKFIDQTTLRADLHRPDTSIEHELVNYPGALGNVARVGLSAVLTATGGRARIEGPLYMATETARLNPSRGFKRILDIATDTGGNSLMLAKAGGRVLQLVSQVSRLFAACNVSAAAIEATAQLPVDNYAVDYYLDFTAIELRTRAELLPRQESGLYLAASAADGTAQWGAVHATIDGDTVTARASNTVGTAAFNWGIPGSRFAGLETFALAIQAALDKPDSTQVTTTSSL